MAVRGSARTSRAPVLAGAAAGVLWTVAVDLPAYAAGRWSALALTVPGTAFVVAGAMALRRRPDHPAGRLLVLIGLLWPIARVQHWGGTAAGTVSLALQWLWVVPLIYLVLTFPGRRPTARTDTVIVGLAAFDAVVVHRLARGESAVDMDVVRSLVRRKARGSRLASLSPREVEILLLMAAGRSNAAISAELFVSPKTVETHIRSIFGKLGLEATVAEHRRVLAVLTFLRRHETPPEAP